jgi:glycosidase
VYYGDEIGLDGENDPDCRKAFPWDSSAWDLEILAFYQQCISIRKQHPALRTGEFTVLWAADDVLIYRSKSDEETVITAINRSDSNRRVELKVDGDFQDGTVLNESFRRNLTKVTNGVLLVELPPFRGAVYFKE